MTLALYRKKRNFKNTPEPSEGKKEKKRAMSFVVQRHAASHLHYDFRLEMEGVLKSWAVPKGPSMKAGEKRLAVMVEDHPLPYGKFFGEIPKGNYGAGIVEIWDNGTYRPMEKDTEKDAEKILLAQLKKGDLKFVLDGKYLKGAFALVRMHNEDGPDKNWLLIKKNDAFATGNFKIESHKPVRPFSGKKGKTIQDTNEKQKPATPLNRKKTKGENITEAWEQLKQPMLTKITSKIFDDPLWLFEMKYDGYRAITKISNGKVTMVSRNGNNFNRQYAPLIEELEKTEDEIILDGEVVIENGKGISDFQLLQNYTTTQEGTLKYYVFDILFLNGYRLTELTLLQRKELLESFFSKYEFTNIIKSPYTTGKGKQLYKKLTSKGYEGVIAKNTESTYMPGKRPGSWLKVKNVMSQEAVICGYTLPQNSRKYFGSIILGLYIDEKLKYIGNCGTGFTDSSLKELHTRFGKLTTDECPFESKPSMAYAKGKAIWLKPELVCNVKFQEWTKDGHMRIPVFMGLREDKQPSETIMEIEIPAKTGSGKKTKEANPKGEEKSSKKTKTNFTNLSKIYFPEDKITKGDLISYYQSIGKYILPYLKNRPQSLNRHPNGITGQSFYQKNMDMDHLPVWIKTVKLYSKSNDKDIHYLICNDVETLLYMVNLGCIEINPWNSSLNNPDNPDYMILDLDPGDIPFTEVVNTALTIKEICDELKIKCYCKTSGATGLHIYIPLGAKYTYEQVRMFGEVLARITHKRLPDTTSIERAVAKRRDKVYIDFLQNSKGQTVAAPYSVRPQPHATVSTPLLWKEVNNKLSPQLFTIRNLEKRLRKVGDLWKGVLQKPIDLEAILKRIK